MNMEVHKEAEELLLSSPSLHIAVVFALMDHNSLDQQHRLGATKFLPRLPRAGWMKVFTSTVLHGHPRTHSGCRMVQVVQCLWQ